MSSTPKTPKTAKSNRLFQRITRITLLTLGLIFVLMVGTGLAVAGAGAGYVAALVKDQPVIKQEEMISSISSNHLTTYTYFRDGQPIGQMRTDEDRRNVTLDEVPDDFIEAIIATEDKNFNNHFGVDVNGLTRAVLQQLTGSEVQTGGSTITQQLVKLAVLEDNSVSYSRKAKEILLALRLERLMSKEEILTAYFNEIWFSVSANKTQVYGIYAAAKGIFGSSLDELNLAQSAYLAGMPQNPAAYSPFTDDGLERGKIRQETVLSRMLENGFITREEYEEALAFDIKGSLAKPTPTAIDRYPYLTIEIEKRAAEVLVAQQGVSPEDKGYSEALSDARQQVLRSGYHITTSVDKAIYEAMNGIAKNPENFPKNKNYTVKQGGKTIQVENAPLELGSILIQNKTGAILGMVEGRDFLNNEVNHVTTVRQPGSAMKPIAAYAPALNEGKLQPASAIDDVPIVLNQGHVPRNWDGKYHGLMTARRALDQSYNIPAIKVYKDLVGIANGLDYIRKMGVTTLTENDNNYQTGVIGGLDYGLTVEEITNAFATFPNGGNFVDAYLIEKIEGPDGDIIYQHEGQKVPVFNERASFLMTDMLRTVVKQGTATRVRSQMKEKRDFAGKTGTTQEEKDLWFIGYTPEVTLGVWTGYDIPYTQKGNANAAKDLWSKLFNSVMEVNPGLSPKDDTFEQPEGLVRQTVCGKSGLLPSDLCREAKDLVTDWFDSDHLPTKTDDVYQKVKVVVYEGQNYLPQENTPEDMQREGVFLKREPYTLPKGLDPKKYRPLDWDLTLPTEVDPRKEDGTPPQAPSGLKLVKGEGGNTLTWQAVGAADIVGYRVYRASDGSEFSQAGVVLSGDELKLTDSVKAGQSYAYRVTAVDVGGNESNSSSIVTTAANLEDSPWAPHEEIPSTPQRVRVTREGNDWIISWLPNAPREQVKTYSILYSPTRDGHPELLASTEGASYRHPVSGEGFIRVVATNGYGQSSPSPAVELPQNGSGNGQNPNGSDDQNGGQPAKEQSPPASDGGGESLQNPLELM